MPSPFTCLLVAMGFGVLSAGAAAQTTGTAATARVPSAPAAMAQAPTPAGTPAPSSDTASARTGKAKTSKTKTPVGKTPAGTASGKRSAGARAAGTPETKGKAADCDTPDPKVAAAPPPVAADPLAPTLTPCADPTRKP